MLADDIDMEGVERKPVGWGATMDSGYEGTFGDGVKVAEEWTADGLMGRAYGAATIERCWSDVDISVGEGVIRVGGMLGSISNATGESLVASSVNFGDIRLPCFYDRPAAGIVGSYTRAVVSGCLQLGAIDVDTFGQAADVAAVVGWWD